MRLIVIRVSCTEQESESIWSEKITVSRKGKIVRQGRERQRLERVLDMQ